MFVTERYIDSSGVCYRAIYRYLWCLLQSDISIVVVFVTERYIDICGVCYRAIYRYLWCLLQSDISIVLVFVTERYIDSYWCLLQSDISIFVVFVTERYIDMCGVCYRAIYRWITVKDLNVIEFDDDIDEDTPMGLLRGIKYGTETYHVLFMRLCR